MRVVVAGGTGFLGRHVVEALRARGHSVVVLARGTRPAPDGAIVVPGDVASGAFPLEPLRGAHALVNLVGIKRESGSQTFEAVHVEATRRLIEACRGAGIRRFVHVSVVCSRPDAESPYHDTKWRAEEAVRASGLDFTVLKPAVIYGRGDDMATHLLKMIRFASVFPVAGRGDSILQPVDAGDVARAVALTLEQPASVGRTYDVVGPSRLRLREVVRIVADGAGLSVRIVPTPVAVLRVGVRIMGAVMADPLSTPAQLRMLVDGLYGDPEPARRDLGLVPRPFTAEAVRALEGRVGPLFGFSLRLISRRDDAEWLRRRRPAFGAAVTLALLAVALTAAFTAAIPNVWYRMAATALVLSAFALARVDVGWRELYRPRWGHVGMGLAAAAVLYLGGRLVVALLSSVPAIAAQIAALYGWKSDVPGALAVPLLVFIVLGEEIVWRGAVTLPLAARWGPMAGSLAAAGLFALAHLPMGIPVLLLAAFAAGSFWSLLVVRTRSAIPALVSHVLWDLAVLFWLPYVRA